MVAHVVRSPKYAMVNPTSSNYLATNPVGISVYRHGARGLDHAAVISIRRTFPVGLGAYYAAEFGTTTVIPEWAAKRCGWASRTARTPHFIPLQEKFYLITAGPGT